MAGRTLSFGRAENEALRQEMERDPRVFVIGEDVAGGAGRADKGIIDAWGDPTGATKGLITQFGAERVIDTPIAEMSFIGAAVGAALAGQRPVATLIMANFISVALDSIMNQAAYLRYMLGGQVSVPLVVRLSCGATAMPIRNGGGSAAQHSGSMYSMLAHIPGLKVVVPSDPYTAKGLLTAAIRDDDPVMFFSHRRLLGSSCEVPEEPYVLPIGQARTLRGGRDLTLVGIGRMTQVCLEAAEKLAAEGLEAEVIDLLSVSPIDEARILEAVRRTKRLVIVDEDTPQCSVARDIAALAADKALDYLDAPVKTVTGAHAPVPFSGMLEAAFVPTPERVVATVHAMLGDEGP